MKNIKNYDMFEVDCIIHKSDKLQNMLEGKVYDLEGDKNCKIFYPKDNEKFFFPFFTKGEFIPVSTSTCTALLMFMLPTFLRYFFFEKEEHCQYVCKELNNVVKDYIDNELHQ